MKKPFTKETYYCSLPYLLSRVGLVLMPLITLGTIVVYSTFYNHGPFEWITWQVVKWTLIFSVPVMAFGMGVYTRFFPVVLTAEGIRGHNERGSKQRLLWSDIIYTGLVRSSGFSCHRLQSKSSETYLLIPTFLSNYKNCKERLKEFGVDLTKPMQPTRPVAVVKSTPRRPRTQIEPIREGNYIVITTERTRWK